MSSPLRILTTLLLASLATAARAEAPKLHLPDVQGWEHTDARPIPGGDGYSVAYDSAAPHITVTLYVFNRNLPRVEDNLTSQAIRDEFASAKDAIQQAVR